MEDSKNSHSSDKDERLRVENEILQLKLRTEKGAIPKFMDNVPQETENDFLNYILAFEKAAAEKKVIKVFDRLEQPSFPPADSLADDEVERAFEKVSDLLHDKHIELAFFRRVW